MIWLRIDDPSELGPLVSQREVLLLLGVTVAIGLFGLFFEFYRLPSGRTIRRAWRNSWPMIVVSLLALLVGLLVGYSDRISFKPREIPTGTGGRH